MLNGRPYPPCNGTQQVAVAVTTPGSGVTRSNPSRAAPATPTDFKNRGPVNDIRMVTTLLVSKPGFTAYNATNVRINRAEPISRITARPTSLTTSNARALFWRKPVPERPLLSFRTELRSARDPCSAGNRPNTTPVASEITTATINIRQSTLTP